MYHWRKTEKISWNDYVRNEEVLWTDTETNILQTIKRKKVKWIGHILQRNCLLKHVIESKIEEMKKVTGRWGRRHKQLFDDLKEERGYWKLKEEALDHTLWTTRSERGYGPVIRITASTLCTQPVSRLPKTPVSTLSAENHMQLYTALRSWRWAQWCPKHVELTVD